MLKPRWRTVGGRKAKYYSLTKAGERQLQAETEGWERLCAAVRLVLEVSKWGRGMCFVRIPLAARLRFARTEWDYPRIACPACEEISGRKTLRLHCATV